MKKVFLSMVIVAMAGFGIAADPEAGPHGPGQAIADKIREVASADLAFVPGGVLQDTRTKSPLAAYVSEKGEKIAVVKLTGQQVQAAIERSISMVPTANPSFLQISGLQVTYKKSSVSDRLVSIETDGGKLDLKATYMVAMPQTMAKGGFGYFTVWENNAVSSVLPTTMTAALKDLAYEETSPRYQSVD